VNDGSAQRSEVRSIAVTFSGPVTFAGGTANAVAPFQLKHVTDGVNVALAAAVSTDGQGRTVVTLTFSGTETDALSAMNGGIASLADGRFQLTVNGGLVTDPVNGLALDGDANGVAGGNYLSPTDTITGGTGQLRLYRLFGDATGDGVVDQRDLGQFRSTFNAGAGNPLYLAYLDADNSGFVDQVDLGQLRSRFNANIFSSGPATVASVVVNDGSAQRSEVRSIAVTFSVPVAFGGGNANAAAAFQLMHLTDNNNVGLTTTVSADSLGRTVVTITFSGPETDSVSAQNFGSTSLADGRYQLTILSSSVTGADGVALVGGGPNSNYVSPTDTLGGGAGQLHLYRIFGDVNGDGLIDQQDLGKFRSAFNAGASSSLYIPFLDADNSGVVDQVDLGQFRSRFNANVF
jgi:hypothetical protein